MIESKPPSDTEKKFMLALISIAKKATELGEIEHSRIVGMFAFVTGAIARVHKISNPEASEDELGELVDKNWRMGFEMGASKQ